MSIVIDATLDMLELELKVVAAWKFNKINPTGSAKLQR